ncbi:Ig domain-containing protein [Streptomyces sp. NPDC051582]|uniref:Ig domain-containing protein n=1 Tax=Streptomyces sp. NPDC051582 TaxID=3155167 RepID=UPI003431F78F
MQLAPKFGTRTMAALAAAALITATFTGLSAGTVSAAVVSDASGSVVVDAGYLRLGMDATGQVTSLVDRRTAQNHLASGHGTAPLVSLVIGGQQVKPTSLALGTDGSLVFKNTAAGYEVHVAVQDQSVYSTLTVTKVIAPEGADVQTLLWGPIPTSVTQTLGESVGIVRNGDFAIGMKPLTDRTEGGWPREYTGMGWQNEVSGNPSNLQVAPLEQWSAGARTSWGTLLRAFTFDYTKQRTRSTVVYSGTGYPITVPPLPSGQGSVVGSKIALFGTTPDMAPTVLSGIATGENLPYPTINGQWQKTAQATSQSILVLDDLNTGNIPQAAGLAKAAGMNVIYSMRNQGPWKSSGHFEFDSTLGGSDSGAADAVNQAKANGVNLGVHTLSDFIEPHDGYVTPTPSPDLVVGQSSSLTRALAATDTTAYLAGCAPMAGGMNGKRLLIGTEYVTYTGFAQVGSECQVTGLARHQWSSVAASYPVGKTASRIAENGYQGALGNLNIINTIAGRFATAWNTTGIKAMSYDGLESASQSGWGAYGMASLVNGTYRQRTSKDGLIAEASRMGSNIWDGVSRASWGEIGITSMNQVFVNNAYYRDNYLPGMLGWIGLRGTDNLQTLQDTLARGAGLNAGAGFQTSLSKLTGSNTPVLLDAIKQWDTARNLGAFTAAQRTQLQDVSKHWKLSVVTAGKTWSLQQVDASGNPIGGAQSVAVPTAAFTTTSLPALQTGSLYEARVQTNVPTTVRYAVTAGALPAGLKLNADTGGITGVPTATSAATFTITAYGAPGTADAQRSFTVAVAAAAGPLDLSSAYNNVGVTSQSAVAPGNFDGIGNSFSAEQLASVGVTPGATVTANGVSFTWPGAATGTPNNIAGGSAVIQGNGRSGNKLAFLGSEAGDVTDTVTVTYTDGTTSTGSIGFPNWTTSSATEFGSTLAFSTTGRNTQAGYANTANSYRLFHNEIALDPAKTIATVTLPANQKIHTFALTVVRGS